MNRFLINLKAVYLCLFGNTEKRIAKILIEKGLHTATAESCTGGLLSSRLTDVAGSSEYIKENFVTYSYQAKEDILSVKHETLLEHGAVSYECAYEMAQGLIKKTNCDLAICTTGIAGPTVDEGKPAGLIFISVGYKNQIVVKKYILNPLLNRKNMKFMFTEKALNFALDTLNSFE